MAVFERNQDKVAKSFGETAELANGLQHMMQQRSTSGVYGRGSPAIFGDVGQDAIQSTESTVDQQVDNGSVSPGKS